MKVCTSYQVVSVAMSVGEGGLYAEVDAPTGTVVLGGGYTLSGSPNLELIESLLFSNGPASDGSSWNVRILLSSTSGISGEAYAIVAAMEDE
jgi:hypothetical protein